MTYEESYTEAVVEELTRDGVRVPAKEDMTCYRCPHANTCELAWNLYNTNCDCLADK
jgi:hypothetical protein